ncbi:MAG: TIGR02266 family protein [Polyangiaceae bacterium]
MSGDECAPNLWEPEAPTLAMDERRESTRTSLDVDVTLASESHFFAGLGGDISEGGIFVQTYEPHAVGRHVVIAVSLPSGAIEAEGVVRWIRRGSDEIPPGVGIAFHDLPDGVRARIEDFCHARPPLYHDADAVGANRQDGGPGPPRE